MTQTAQPTEPATPGAADSRGPAALPGETRAPGTVRVNRVILVLLGLLLTLAGAAGLAAGLGLFGRRLTQQPVLDPATEDFAAANGWFWPVVAVAGGVLALLCLWWLLRQARSNRVSELRLVTDPRRGHTDLAAGALTGALESEVGGYRGVARTSAHLSGSSTTPHLTMSVTLDGRVEPAELHTRIAHEALAHARSALGRDDLPTRLELNLPSARRRDVR